jgi:hypothetical protein
VPGEKGRRETRVDPDQPVTEVVGIEAAAIGIFSTCVDLEDSLDVLEARLARIASLGCYPVDLF